MGIILNINDIVLDSSITNKTISSFDKSSWVGTLINNATLTAKLSVSTKYYIHYTIKKIANPISHFYTTQAWGYTMFYNGSSSIGCIGLTKEQYENMQIGDSISLAGSFTTPSSWSGWNLVFYSARYSGSSSDWGSNAELVPVRICDFEVSNIPFSDHSDITKNGILNTKLVNEQNHISISPICIGSNSFIEY